MPSRTLVVVLAVAVTAALLVSAPSAVAAKGTVERLRAQSAVSLQSLDGGRVGLDGMEVVFDDERVVSDAGVMLAATLAERLDIEGLVEDCVQLGVKGAASCAGRKVMALIYAMVLGADSIDDCQVLRAGRTGRLLGGWIPAPSTLGTFLRAFTFGHVRQLDRVLAETLKRAWAAGAGVSPPPPERAGDPKQSSRPPPPTPAR